MDELWKQAEGLGVAQQQMLIAIGTTSVELDKLNKQRIALEDKLQQQKAQYQALESAFNEAAGQLAQQSGINTGTIALDFDKQEVISNGQVPDSGND